MRRESEIAAGEQAEVPRGSSPYATGGGGFTLERRVAVSYLVRLLTNETGPGLDNRQLAAGGFQSGSSVDDLVLESVIDGDGRGRRLRVAVRRAPSFTVSDPGSQQLANHLVTALDTAPDGEILEDRLAVCVAGPSTAAEQVQTLAELARRQATSRGFFDLVRARGRFRRALVGRLAQLVALVSGCSLGEAERRQDETSWRLLSRLEILMPRIESPDESDWVELTNRLLPLTSTGMTTDAAVLRDRIESLTAGYAPAAAVVDRRALLRDLGLPAAGTEPAQGTVLGAARARRAVAERELATSSARSAERAESLGLGPEARDVVLRHVAASVPESLLHLALGSLTVITGRMGSGKTELGEWWHRSRLEAILAGGPERGALWFSARRDGDVRGQLASAMEGGGVDVVIDGLDEVPVSSASDLLEEIRVLLRVHPASRVVVTARPGLLLGPSDREVPIAPLTRSEAVALFEELTGRQGTHLYGWPDAARNALRWPLWVVLASVLPSGRPRAEADLITSW